MNNPVSFEISKLLKEKGFDEPTNRYYENALTSRKDPETNDFKGSFGWRKDETNLQPGYFKNNYDMADLSSKNWYMCSAPTIAEVVCWIYSKYNIWIQVSILKDNEWHYSIRRKENNWEIEFPTKEKFSSIKESYQKGIEVILNTYKPTS